MRVKWECRHIYRLLWGYTEGTLTPKEVHRVEAHLQVCPVCVRQAEAFAQTRRLMLAGRSEPLSASGANWLSLREHLQNQPLSQPRPRRFPPMMTFALGGVTFLLLLLPLLRHREKPLLSVSPTPGPNNRVATTTNATRVAQERETAPSTTHASQGIVADGTGKPKSAALAPFAPAPVVTPEKRKAGTTPESNPAKPASSQRIAMAPNDAFERSLRGAATWQNSAHFYAGASKENLSDQMALAARPDAKQLKDMALDLAAPDAARKLQLSQHEAGLDAVQKGMEDRLRSTPQAFGGQALGFSGNSPKATLKGDRAQLTQLVSEELSKAPLPADPRLDRKVIVSSEGIPVGELLTLISAKTGVDLNADPVVASDDVIVYGPSRPLRGVLEDLAVLFNNVWTTSRNANGISVYSLTRTQAAQEDKSKPVYSLPPQTKAEVDFSALTFGMSPEKENFQDKKSLRRFSAAKPMGGMGGGGGAGGLEPRFVQRDPYTGYSVPVSSALPTSDILKQAAKQSVWTDRLKVLSAEADVPILSDYYGNRPLLLEAAPAPASVVYDLNTFSESTGYLWWTHDKTLLFRKRDWYAQRLNDVDMFYFSDGLGLPATLLFEHRERARIELSR